MLLFVYRLFRDFQVESVKGEKLPSFDGELGIRLCPKPLKFFSHPEKMIKQIQLTRKTFRLLLNL